MYTTPHIKTNCASQLPHPSIATSSTWRGRGLNIIKSIGVALYWVVRKVAAIFSCFCCPFTKSSKETASRPPLQTEEIKKPSSFRGSRHSFELTKCESFSIIREVGESDIEEFKRYFEMFAAIFTDSDEMDLEESVTLLSSYWEQAQNFYQEFLGDHEEDVEVLKGIFLTQDIQDPLNEENLVEILKDAYGEVSASTYPSFFKKNYDGERRANQKIFTNDEVKLQLYCLCAGAYLEAQYQLST